MYVLRQTTGCHCYKLINPLSYIWYFGLINWTKLNYVCAETNYRVSQPNVAIRITHHTSLASMTSWQYIKLQSLTAWEGSLWSDVLYQLLLPLQHHCDYRQKQVWLYNASDLRHSRHAVTSSAIISGFLWFLQDCDYRQKQVWLYNASDLRHSRHAVTSSAIISGFSWFLQAAPGKCLK